MFLLSEAVNHRLEYSEKVFDHLCRKKPTHALNGVYDLDMVIYVEKVNQFDIILTYSPQVLNPRTYVRGVGWKKTLYQLSQKTADTFKISLNL